MSLAIPVTPLPLFNLAAPAVYQGIEVEWILDPTAQPSFDGATDAAAITAKLEEKAPKDGPALPALPSKLDAATAFADVAKILDALDDFLAYRCVCRVDVTKLTTAPTSLVLRSATTMPSCGA